MHIVNEKREKKIARNTKCIKKNDRKTKNFYSKFCFIIFFDEKNENQNNLVELFVIKYL